METHRLRAFCTVVETESVREAARLLGISHGGLSKSIRSLEDELGGPLVTASGRGIVVTDGGRRVYRAAKKLIDDVEAMRALVSTAERDATGPIRIGTFEVFSTYFMGELVEHEFPDARILLRELIPGAIEDALVRDAIDLGITYVPVPQPELDFLPITSVAMGVFGRRDRFARVPFGELPFCAPAIPIHGSPTVARGLDGFPDQEVTRQIRYAVDMMETALELCRRGLGVVYLPAFVARLHNAWAAPASRLEPIALPSAARREQQVFLVKRRATVESKIVRRVARALRRVTKE